MLLLVFLTKLGFALVVVLDVVGFSFVVSDELSESFFNFKGPLITDMICLPLNYLQLMRISVGFEIVLTQIKDGYQIANVMQQNY